MQDMKETIQAMPLSIDMPREFLAIQRLKTTYLPYMEIGSSTYNALF